jgi:hypothetical protein
MGIYLDAVDDMLKQAVVQTTPSYGPGNASLISGPGGDLWWGSVWGNTYSRTNCPLMRYDPATHKFIGIHWPGHAYATTYNIATGPDGNIWGVWNYGPDSSPTAVSIYLVHGMSVSPLRVSIGKPGETAALTARYHGESSLSAVSQNPSIASVTQTGPRTFTVTGNAEGKTSVVVRDAIGNSFTVPVNVH